jgi:predicted transcriptional regulator
LTETPKQLGELEADVLNVCWEKEQATVHDVRDALQPRRDLAYTTVMTVMTRLVDKGLLRRHKEGRAYVYAPAHGREQVAGSLLRSLVDRFYKGATLSAVAHLLQTEEDVDEAELERLEALLRARREEDGS